MVNPNYMHLTASRKLKCPFTLLSQMWLKTWFSSLAVWCNVHAPLPLYKSCSCAITVSHNSKYIHGTIC